MKTTLTLTALAALALSTAAARADVICSHCEYTAPGIYLGGLWTGDRATFQRSTPTTQAADDLYLLDLYDHGTFTLQVHGAASQ